MHNVYEDTRNTLLCTLIALVVLAGALFVFAPVASANREDCPAAKVCLWSGESFGGQQAFFNGEDHGWHSLENIDPSSAWNHTGNHWILFNGLTWLGPGETIRIFPAFTGSIFIE
jgi:hypothetical protein